MAGQPESDQLVSHLPSWLEMTVILAASLGAASDLYIPMRCAELND